MDEPTTDTRTPQTTLPFRRQFWRGYAPFLVLNAGIGVTGYFLDDLTKRADAYGAGVLFVGAFTIVALGITYLSMRFLYRWLGTLGYSKRDTWLLLLTLMIVGAFVPLAALIILGLIDRKLRHHDRMSQVQNAQ